MRLKFITTTSDIGKCNNLKRSLDFFSWDYHFIEHQWRGFLDKLHESYKYIKALKGYSHFIYSDAWDSFSLGGMTETFRKMDEKGLLFAAERACYPHPGKEVLYPKHESPWHFVNGGGWCGEIEAFIKMYEANPPKDELNDQVYLTDRFLQYHESGFIKLDYQCNIFQTLAFCPETDFKFIGRTMKNTVTYSLPVFVHGNGHTSMDHIYKLL